MQPTFAPSSVAQYPQFAAAPPPSSGVAPPSAFAPPASVAVGGMPVGSVRPMSNTPLALSEPSWDQKQTGVGCSKCQKEFTFVNRRHRCRCCFREFCGNCTVKNHAVPQFGHVQPVRVCDCCYSHLSTQRKRCFSRLVPYYERDNIADSVKLQALDESYEMLTSGVEILEESKNTGLYGPLIHVVETTSEKPNLRAKALSIISLLTELDTTNCISVASVPGAIEKLVLVVGKGNPQSRLLAAEIVNSLARNKETVESIVNVDYVKTIVGLLNGQASDAKLVEVCAETLASLSEASPVARVQISENAASTLNILATLASPGTSLACQRVLVTSVLPNLPSSSLIQHHAAVVLIPLLDKGLDVMPVLETLAAYDEGAGALHLLDAGLLRHLVPEEPDALVATLILLEKGKHKKIANALLPVLSERPDVGKKLSDSGQLGRLTSILHNHFDESMSLIVLRVLSGLAASDVAVRQFVDSGGLFDLVNHMGSASPSLQTAQLSVLQSFLRFKYCIEKATDAGAIQALVPLCSPPALPVIRQMSLTCLDIMCANDSQVRILVVGVATPATVVSSFLKEVEGVRLLRKLLEDPVTNSDLMEAGVFAALLALLKGASSGELRTLAASAMALCIQQNTTVDAGYISAIADLMKTNGPEAGAELLASFSAQPVYRQLIVQHGLVTSLIGLLLGGKMIEHAVLALANLAYEDIGSFAILRLGGVPALVGLINHPVEQVQGCALLALGNLSRTHECRLAVVQNGGADLIMDKFCGFTVMAPAVENYCLWALRMLAAEPGVPEALASRGAQLRAIFPKLVVAKGDARSVHALAFLSIMCAVPSFCDALSSYPGKQDLLISMMSEPGPGRAWALHEISPIPIGALLQCAGFLDAVTALLLSPAVVEQRAGVDLCEKACSLDEKNVRLVPLHVVVKMLPMSSKLVALVCATESGRTLMRNQPGAFQALIEARASNNNVDIDLAISLLCRDAANASSFLKLVPFFATSTDAVHVETLSYLCVNSAECRSVLLSVPNYVQNNLLPLLLSSSSPNLLLILTSLLREPSFKSCGGICSALLKVRQLDVNMLDSLMVLPQGDLYAEGAFEACLDVLLKNDDAVLASKALLVIKRMSLHATREKIQLIPVKLLLESKSTKAALFLLDLVVRNGNAAEFLALGGVDKILAVASSDMAASVCQVLQRVVSDPTFDHQTSVPSIVNYCSRTLSADEPGGVAHFLALQLLKELYLFHPELVASVVTSVAPRVRNPLVLDAVKFFFQA